MSFVVKTALKSSNSFLQIIFDFIDNLSVTNINRTTYTVYNYLHQQKRQFFILLYFM